MMENWFYALENGFLKGKKGVVFCFYFLVKGAEVELPLNLL